ncbi:hypothetical protein ACFSKW_54855 [Nonomuraea mangrovi]|uniref:Uncharacterized protein n=1 Tax=Nonomuraea mangrovi TaxID=2316207 RepID=A0ABW4TES9_9ACTN
MTIIPQLAPSEIRYAIHIWRGEAKIGSTVPTTDQAEARETFHAMRAAYPDSVLVVQNPDDGEYYPVSDEMLDRLARQRSAMVLADLIGKAPGHINWSLLSFEPNKLSGNTFTRDTVDEFAAFLKVDVVEETSGKHVTARASGSYCGINVDIFCVTRIAEPATVAV